MIEFNELSPGDDYYRVFAATLTVWRLSAIKKSGNSARDFPYREAAGNSLTLEETEMPNPAWTRFIKPTFRVCLLTAHRELFKHGYKISHWLPIESLKDRARAWFLHVLMRLYAREPWSFVGLADQIRRLGENELLIYDMRFTQHVLPLHEPNPRVRAALLARETFEREMLFERLLDKCEREPWNYRELRGYLQRTCWRERS